MFYFHNNVFYFKGLFIIIDTTECYWKNAKMGNNDLQPFHIDDKYGYILRVKRN